MKGQDRKMEEMKQGELFGDMDRPSEDGSGQEHEHSDVDLSDEKLVGEVGWTVGDIFADGGILSQRFDGYKVRPPQVDLANAVDAAMNRPNHLVAEAPTGCHARGQEILMFDGTKKRVEDIIEYDLLMGPDSLPRQVLRLIRGYGEMVDIVPVKGDPWRVNIDHVLSLQRTNRKRRGVTVREDCLDGEVVDVSVGEYMGWSKSRKHIYKLFRRPVEFENDFDLPIDPYHLGILLGDGCLRDDGVTVSTMDEEVVDSLRELADHFSLRLVKRDTPGLASSYRVALPANHGRRKNPLLKELRAMGLSGKLAGEKFVPGRYKNSRFGIRKSILAGLIDTDGHLTGGCFDYVSKSCELANDVVFLARSIGLAAYVKPCKKGYGTEFIGDYYRVTISGDISLIPVRVKRRMPTDRRQKKNVLRTGFRVLSSGLDHFFGFTLSGDGRYLLGDFTVTHNCGKSLAYLIPAIRNAVLHGKRVVVGTANIALQEQLFYKDLPLLQEILPTKFNFTLIKGRNNYFCLRSREKLKDEFAQADFGKSKKAADIDLKDLFSQMPADLVNLCKWSEKTETGDKSELRVEPKPETWNMVSVTAEECRGAACPWRTECFAEKAKKALQNMHVIVSNYHLLFAAVKVRMEAGKDVVIPPFAYLICDEAHKVPEIARDFFGWTISRYRLQRLVTAYNKRFRQARGDMGNEDVAEAERCAADAIAAVAEFERKTKSFFGRSFNAVRFTSPSQSEFVSLYNAFDRMALSFKTIAKHLNSEAQIECRQSAKQAKKVAEELDELGRMDDPNGVYFVEKFGRAGNLRIVKRLMDVSELLWDNVYQFTKATIATSATMAIDSDCRYVKKEMGIKKSRDLIVDSPFNFRKQGLLILSENAPDPKDRETYPDKVAKIMRVIVDQAKGRTLGLFTSYAVLKTTAEYLRSCDLPYDILVQGELPRSELIRQFKASISSVLLGVESFWAGVDVPGEALSCLVIDKIPFPAPGDPVLEAIQEAAGGGMDSFFRVSVPRAVLQLRQGAGRLIRSVDDRGVLIILDRRLVTKGYGSTFVNSLPRMRRASGIKNGEIQSWLAEKK